ncbi:MAG: M14 family zinc carboxypeptidase, partial [Actinomycetota bacterium]
DDQGGSSGDRFTQTYRGEKPFSEPETRNVRRIILGRNVTGVITNHTSGNLVLRPWGHTKKDPPDESVLAPLGGRMAEAMGGYANQKGIGLYITTGTTDDWAYAATAALGFTFEHGEAFHPPYAESVGKSFDGVLEAFTIMGEASADPDLHARVTGRVVGPGGRPVAAVLRLTKRFKTPLWPGNPTGRKSFVERQRLVLRTDAGGGFTWHLNPSTRPEVESRGATETYALRIAGASHTTMKRIELDRGERLDLGTIRLTRMRVRKVTIEEAEAGPVIPPA